MITEHIYRIFLQHPVVTTDSRSIPANSMFFALRGEHFDGNDFALQVLEQGAAYAVCDRKSLPDNDARIIKVENVLQTLQNLATLHRQTLATPVIAITGTNGKTTTKEMTAAALSSQFNTLFTEGNLNNHIGAPLTLLRLRPEHQFAVVEMGANHQGEIAELCRIVQPDYGLITNIGRAHLEGFGSFEGVIRTKTELFDYLRINSKTTFVNADNALLQQRCNDQKTVQYGTSDTSFVNGTIAQSSPFLSLDWRKYDSDRRFHIQTNLVGGYNFENVMAAICVASFFDVKPENICRAIENYIPKNNRSQNLKTLKNNLIIDAYNANPTSMKAALENFFALPDKPKALILGEMRELGDYSLAEHQTLIDAIADRKPDKVMLCGKEFKKLEAIPPQWSLFSNVEELIQSLVNTPVTGYNILIKGSRGNQLEKTVEYL